MLLRAIVFVALCLVVPMSLAAGDGGKLREIDAKELNVDFEKGKVTKPTVITNADELDKAIPNAGAIKKKVDFSKEKLVLFAWGGSGGDKLGGKLDDDGDRVIFTYKGGLTRDFRRHVRLFVLPKGAEFKIVGARGN